MTLVVNTHDFSNWSTTICAAMLSDRVFTQDSQNLPRLHGTLVLTCILRILHEHTSKLNVCKMLTFWTLSEINCRLETRCSLKLKACGVSRQYGKLFSMFSKFTLNSVRHFPLQLKRPPHPRLFVSKIRPTGKPTSFAVWPRDWRHTATQKNLLVISMRTVKTFTPQGSQITVIDVAKWLVRFPLKAYINLSVCLAGRVHFLMLG